MDLYNRIPPQHGVRPGGGGGMRCSPQSSLGVDCSTEFYGNMGGGFRKSWGVQDGAPQFYKLFYNPH